MGLHVPLPAPARQQPRARAQVRAVIWRLFELAPSAAAAAVADPAAVRAIIEPLGLAPKRVPMLQRFSREYLEKDVRRPCWYWVAPCQCEVCRTEHSHVLVCSTGLVPWMSVQSMGPGVTGAEVLLLSGGSAAEHEAGLISCAAHKLSGSAASSARLCISALATSAGTARACSAPTGCRCACGSS